MLLEVVCDVIECITVDGEEGGDILSRFHRRGELNLGVVRVVEWCKGCAGHGFGWGAGYREFFMLGCNSVRRSDLDVTEAK